MSLHLSDWLTQQNLYVVFSAIIAILIFIETNMLKKTNGKLPESTFFHISSILDTVWFFISLWIFFTLQLEPIVKSIAVVYAIYTIFGWIYGTRLLKSNGLPNSPKEMVIPKKYIAYSQSFALMFFFLCMAVLVILWQSN